MAIIRNFRRDIPMPLPIVRKLNKLPDIHILDQEERWDRNVEDEKLWWPRVMWIDPGVVSGVAVVWFDPDALFNEAPLARTILAYSEWFLSGPENGRNGQIARFLAQRRVLASEVGLATGCESFVPRQMNFNPEFLAPVRIREGIEFTLSMTKPLGQEHINDGVPLFTQSPSDALGSFTNERLRLLRMYTPGPDHVNDAKRHALLWIRKLTGKDGEELFLDAHGNEDGWYPDA